MARFAFGFTVALVVCFIFVTDVFGAEICPEENCIVSDKCEELVKDSNTVCHQDGVICCSVVKSEFRTHCRHHGGECSDQCPPTLQRDTVDCTGGQTCCVLV